MKKLIVFVLAVALALCGAIAFQAMAEAPGEPAAGPVVDVTGLVIALLVAVFEFLMARFASALIPPARKWLEAHTTEKERGLLWNAVCELVNAAEQIIKGPAMGEKRKAYVEAGLAQRGLAIDTDMIEAAVKQMNERAMSAIGTVFGAELSPAKDAVPLDVNEQGEPDVEITHWSLAQLRSFCALNDIPASGCVTRDDYIAAIVGAARPAANEQKAAACEGKDYCDLDDFGNPIVEQPQSAVE